MVIVIHVTSAGDLHVVAKVLNRAKKRLPTMTRVGMRRWGKILEKHTRQAALHKAKITPGTLTSTGIQWRQGPRSNHGGLFILHYGVLLDSMKPHYVNVHARRTILLRWALRARAGRIRRRANAIQQGILSKFPIFVKPKPFILQGYQKARPKLKPVLARLAARAINQSR